MRDQLLSILLGYAAMHHTIPPAHDYSTARTMIATREATLRTWRGEALVDNALHDSAARWYQITCIYHALDLHIYAAPITHSTPYRGNDDKYQRLEAMYYMIAYSIADRETRRYEAANDARETRRINEAYAIEKASCVAHADIARNKRIRSIHKIRDEHMHIYHAIMDKKIIIGRYALLLVHSYNAKYHAFTHTKDMSK